MLVCWSDGVKSVPNASLSNSMTIGLGGFSCLWRPNNYRRRLAVLNSTIDFLSAIRRGVLGSFTFNAHNRLAFIVVDGVKVMVGKGCLVGIWAQENGITVTEEEIEHYIKHEKRTKN